MIKNSTGFVMASLFFIQLTVMSNATASETVQGTGALTYSMLALSGMQASLNEDRIVAAVKSYSPEIARNKIRAVYVGILVSTLAAADILSSPRMSPDFNRLAWKVGEFLTAYYVSYLYFHQPLNPN